MDGAERKAAIYVKLVPTVYAQQFSVLYSHRYGVKCTFVFASGGLLLICCLLVIILQPSQLLSTEDLQ